jgi:hypothetical protein
MKIGILTLPLHTNYGGILQAYALKTVLERLGHEVWIIRRAFRPMSLRRKVKTVAYLFKRFFLKYFFHKDIIVRVRPYRSENVEIEKNCKLFIEQNIRYTEKINHTGDFSKLQKYGFDACIVGSDQVWRPEFSPCITNYFLDFLKKRNDVKKIVYAASFGVSDWEFSPKQTKLCAALAKQFDAVSVREDSAIQLCKEHLGVTAIHALDPTMLLTKEDYIGLIDRENMPKRENILFTYILDKMDAKTNMIRKTAEEMNLKVVSGMPVNSIRFKTSKKDLSDCIFPPVAEWLAGFKDAEYVITDSFHGTVFSIIFNKPFIVFENKKGGNARLKSLLKIFNLEKRFVFPSDEFSCEILPEKIDWQAVNRIISNRQNLSIRFLFDNLK